MCTNKKPGEEIAIVTGKGKKKVLFYIDKSVVEDITLDDELIRHWHAVSLPNLDETKIEEYMKNQGIVSVQNDNKHGCSKRKSLRGRRPKTHNDHLGNILAAYNPEIFNS